MASQVSSTYYSRIHISPINAKKGADAPPTEIDVDGRPSDAINLASAALGSVWVVITQTDTLSAHPVTLQAVRFDAPMFITPAVAAYATSYNTQDLFAHTQSESSAEILRSCRETLSSFEDPTTMLQLQKDLAIREERYADAKSLQQQIYDHMTHSPLLRMIVSIEAALADGRYEEAARIRDEYRKMVAAAAGAAGQSLPADKTTH